MNKNIMDILLKVNNNLIIPNYLVRFLDKFDLTTKELILLVYFLNSKDKIIFDVDQFSNDLYMDNNDILENINNLIEKNYISIEINKKNNVIEEFISLELFYSKINLYFVESDKKNNSTDIFSKFEQEFGRTLSPVEYETINKWLENNISIDLIEKALKEAVLNGVNSIRYIDKILFEWNKKGYKVSNDIVSNKKNDDYIEELYDYDWLNE